MEPAQTNNTRKIVAGAVVLVAIALLAIGTKALTSKDNSPQNTAQKSTDTTASSSNTTGANTNSTAGTATSSYKDGTYAATASYDSPGGNQSVRVSVTLQNGVVAASNVQEGANDPEAREYQQDFISGYKAFVTGKNIDSIQLSRVSGSSLTSIGFNDALDQIKNQAKS